MQPLVDASLPQTPVSYPPQSVPVSRPSSTPSTPVVEPAPEREERKIAVTEAVSLSPAGKALLVKADSFMRQGRHDLAIVTLERASRIEPKSPEIYAGLAAAYHAEGNYSQAKVFANKARSLKPSRAVLNRLDNLGL